MTTTVPRPRSSSLVPTTVSGARPVPMGTSTHDDSLTTVPGTTVQEPSERYRWLEQVRQREERRARTAALRLELAAARKAGVEARQRQKLARLRRADR